MTRASRRSEHRDPPKSEFDPPGGQCDPDRRESAAEPTGVYEGLSTWDFRPPHPIGPGTVINEMVFESGL